MIRDEALSAVAQARQVHREQHAITQLAARIASAKSIAGVCGHPSVVEWPIVWDELSCRIYHPPVDGEIGDSYLGNDCLVDVVIVDREDGTRMLIPYWDAFLHIGSIPEQDEIDAAAALTTPLDELPQYVVKYCHAKHEGDAGFIAVLLHRRCCLPERRSP